MRVGCGQITWNQFGVGEEQVLADIRDAGCEGAPWHAPSDAEGSVAEMAKLVRERYAAYDLVPAPGYFSADFWQPGQRDRIVQRGKRHAAIAAELGLTETFVATGGFGTVMPSGRTRKQAAAHVERADQLPEDDFAPLVEVLVATAEAMRREGVTACYHNHVGTVVETEDEVERLLAHTHPEVVALGPDTGHLAWAGIDVVEFCRRHLARIRCLHLKDITAAVRQEGVAAGWDYGTFSDRGVFTELGTGGVDFAGLLRLLSEHGFDGWLIIETDVTQRPSALESTRVSRANLRRLGV